MEIEFEPQELEQTAICSGIIKGRSKSSGGFEQMLNLIDRKHWII